MNDETKQDVLVNAVDALADAQASSDNNVGLGHQNADLFMAEYEKALPDDLPVIPNYVAEYINCMKSSGRDIWDAMHYPFRSNDISEYMEDNSEIFVHAWIDGYTVED